MEVVIVDDPVSAAVLIADSIERTLATSEAPVLGLATGSSPQPTYRELIRRHREHGLSFAHARAFLLDEYVGNVSHPEQSYRSVIAHDLVDHIDLPAEHVHVPDMAPENAHEYDRIIEHHGGVDIQLLGLGGNGHIGFNEPTSSLASRTRIKTLTSATRSANARFFDGNDELVPRHVITQGIGTILDARHLVIVATGHSKAEPAAQLVEGPVTANFPASALHLHPHVTVVLDDESAASLTNIAYYRDTHASKPDWQHL